MKKLILTSLLFLVGLPIAGAQSLRPGYVDWGPCGPSFPPGLATWQKGAKWSDDDNFFISRVKPKVRFRNASTQVNPALTEDVDKKLIYWVPINNETNNALPDGEFDSEVFSMWQYVTHYGNWSTRLIRMPGAFADAAHRNGVPVSVVASVPYGNISSAWRTALTQLVNAGAEKVADFMMYYGVDGLGYNSEFSADAQFVGKLSNFHSDLRRLLLDTGRNPVYESIWYDGTNDNGGISFDRGLGDHNDGVWGGGDDPRTSLFLNYNWNSSSLLTNSVNKARELGRSPLDLYCGINMQGREPKTGQRWPLMAQYPVSIGLWGAHSESMMFESRADRGGSDLMRQTNYQRRIERWFTGSTRNPADALPLSNSLVYGDSGNDFFGMSQLMSARSALKWNLSDEPFISFFNLGNGMFFNYQGRRCNDAEWYNIGIQDHLPTWRWWFSNEFLSGDKADVPAGGLDAAFVWDDAWMGGSLMRIFGSAQKEYLHLFKTEFTLSDGDVVTLRYKLLSGSGALSLALAPKGDEHNPVENLTIFDDGAQVVPGDWMERRFVVGSDIPAMVGKDLALVALRFDNVSNLDLRLGEFSIVRPGTADARPATPVIETTSLLASRAGKADGKIIFNMPNDKPAGDVCYNIDVNTSLFKLYAKQMGKSPVLMGMTSSWAGLLFDIPIADDGYNDVKFGVSALSLDMKSESDIAWGEYHNLSDKYEVSDEICGVAPVYKPGDPVAIAYSDPMHSPGDWQLVDEAGNVVAESENSMELRVDGGLDAVGSYTVRLNGEVHANGAVSESLRIWNAMVQVSRAEAGDVPEILNMTANGSEGLVELPASGGKVVVEYEGNTGEASLSRGIRLKSDGVGFRFADTGSHCNNNSFTVAFWFKPDDLDNLSGQLFSIVDKGDAWPKNNWGWFWHHLNSDGSTSAFTLRFKTGSLSFNLENATITPGAWHHLAYVFERNSSRAVRPAFYLDGKKVKFTSWYTDGWESSEEEVPFLDGAETFRTGNLAIVGGYSFKMASVRGCVDNLIFAEEAYTEEQVRAAMRDIDPASNNLPINGLFDFEENPSADHTFTASGSQSFQGGMIGFADGEKEGTASTAWVAPEFGPGAPHLAGNAYSLNTQPSVSALGATSINLQGDATSGRAEIVYPSGVDADREITLTLSNDYGSDSRSIPVRIGNGSGVEALEEEVANPYPVPFSDRISLRAPQSGNYRLMLYDMQGNLLTSNDFAASSGDTLTLCPQTDPGFYLLTIQIDGSVYKTSKIVCKHN